MNAKERIQKLFHGEEIDVVPCAPHWWGLYKFALAGMIGKYEGQNEAWSMTGEKLASIDAYFYDTFKPDWFQFFCIGQGNSPK